MHLSVLLSLLLVALSVNSVTQSDALLIGAFNIENYGKTKSGNRTIMNFIEKIVSRYDVLLVQEIRDVKGQRVISGLINGLNRKNQKVWAVSSSQQLGLTPRKEQYAFFYRTDRVTVKSTYQYPDPNHSFSRPPFGILVETKTTGDLKQFGLLGFHARANRIAAQEIDALVPVFTDAKRYWKVEDVMIMGDFNAGGTYVGKRALAGLALKRNPQYRWLIGDGARTTIAKKSNSYDRIVTLGNKLKKHALSAQVYKYSRLRMKKDLFRAISDHYPVEVTLN